MKNFTPRIKNNVRLTRRDRINSKVPKVNPFAVCAMAIDNCININLIYRSLANFAGIEMFVVGPSNWHKGATNGLDEVVKITYFNTVNEFLSFMEKTDYEMVAIEQSDKSVYLTEFEHPKKPCFIFGNEGFGLGDDILLNVDKVVEIPMQGYHPCLNVGVSSGIIFYDFVRRNG